MHVQMIDRRKCTQTIVANAIAAIVQTSDYVNGQFNALFCYDLRKILVQSWTNQCMILGQWTVIDQKCG